MPQPSTATVRPPASSAPRCASPSIPRAIPLTTTSPAAASSRASDRATLRPVRRARPGTDDRHRRRRRAASASAEPRRKSCGGGSWIAASSAGNAGSRRRIHRHRSRGRQLPRHAIRERLRDVRRLHDVRACERSDRPRDTRATRARPRPENGSRSTALDSSSDAASVRRRRRTCQARTRRDDARADSDRRLGWRSRELGRAGSRHRDGEVEAVEERARQLLPVRRKALRRCSALDAPDRRGHRTGTCSSCRRAGSEPGRARALRRARPRRRRPRVAAAATRAPSAGTPAARRGGARRDGRGRPRRAAGSARHRRWPAPTRRGAARGTAEPRQRRRRVQDSRDGVDSRDLERLGAAERRQDAGEPAGQHRLARPRRPHEEQVVRRRPPRSRARGARAPARARPRDPERPAPRRPLRAAGTPERIDLAAEVRDDLARDVGRGTGWMPASAASGADSAAQTTCVSPARLRPSATASVPATGLTRPSSASSPTAACSASRSGGSCLVAPRTASEIGRSKPDPSLRSAAGARLTVIRRLTGHSSAAETTPLRTRCFASWHARSASPTIANPGNARLQVRLDLDLPRLEPDERVGDRASEHARTVGAKASPR